MINQKDKIEILETVKKVVQKIDQRDRLLLAIETFEKEIFKDLTFDERKQIAMNLYKYFLKEAKKRKNQ